MMTKIKFRQLIIAVLLSTLPGLTFADHRPFNPDSIKQIEQQYAGEPFLLVLWEINCFPCREEMDLLGKLKQSHPDINLVFIATDDISKQPEIVDVLAQHRLADIDSWIFADPNVERLRYSIDPEWFGELPRNYFYDTDSSRIGFSGKLAEEVMEEWLKNSY